MPVATLCAAASSGSARVPEPATDSSTHVVSFVTLETRAIKDFEPAGRCLTNISLQSLLSCHARASPLRLQCHANC